MSYAAAAALQVAIYDQLTGWQALAGISVVDEMPTGGGTGTFLLIGPETALDRGDDTGAGAEHDVQISVISDARGFMDAKNAAAEVSNALIDAKLTLTTGILVGIRFVKAVAKRLEQGDARRIDMVFRARVDF